MALDWLPTYPALIQPRKRRPWDLADRYNVSPIPNPLPPVDMTWQPKYPSQLLQRSLLPALRLFYTSGYPFLGTQLQARAFFPNQFPPQRRLIPSGSTFEIGGILAVSKIGGWRPTYPNQLRRALRPSLGASIWLVDATTLMNAAPCIELTNEVVTNPVLASDVVLSPQLDTETFTSPVFAEEDLC